MNHWQGSSAISISSKEKASRVFLTPRSGNVRKGPVTLFTKASRFFLTPQKELLLILLLLT